MKKFKGTINGVEYDNEKDFSIAASEAILKNDGILSITSYYTETPDEKTPKIDNILKIEDYKIGENDKNNKCYSIDDSLKNRLKYATEKDIENINNFIKNNNSKIENIKNEMKLDQEYCNYYKDKITSNKNNIEILDAQNKYYNDIKKYMNCDCKQSECKSDCCKKKQDDDIQCTSEDLKKILSDIFGFGEYLNRIGFFK